VIAAAVAGGVFFAPGGAHVDSPRRAPTFAVTDLRHPDRQVTSSSLRGTPVVLNFWATWCVPCRKEMPDLQAVHKLFGSRVAFLGINNRDSRRVAIKFLGETGVTYPSGFDPDGQIAAAYAVVGMPTTVYISADGMVLAKHTGQLNARRLRDDIQRYFHLQPTKRGAT
jgi:cytochrome c biogenesis protein CcmG/thiol:disulfide interchange protein DsbE